MSNFQKMITEEKFNAIRKNFVKDGMLNTEAFSEFNRLRRETGTCPVLGEDNRLHV